MTRNIKLYKYLDVNGGLMMLHNSNLQFTNATRLNDPFDCHPGRSGGVLRLFLLRARPRPDRGGRPVPLQPD